VGDGGDEGGGGHAKAAMSDGETALVVDGVEGGGEQVTSMRGGGVDVMVEEFASEGLGGVGGKGEA